MSLREVSVCRRDLTGELRQGVGKAKTIERREPGVVSTGLLGGPLLYLRNGTKRCDQKTSPSA